jgi:hypothetical protein
VAADKELGMSVLVIFRANGSPAELLSRYDSKLAEATAMAPTRPVAHYCVATNAGIMIVDVWNSREEVERTVIKNESFQRKWAEAGWPDETVEMFDVHNSGWPE